MSFRIEASHIFCSRWILFCHLSLNVHTLQPIRDQTRVQIKSNILSTSSITITELIRYIISDPVKPSRAISVVLYTSCFSFRDFKLLTWKCDTFQWASQVITQRWGSLSERPVSTRESPTGNTPACTSSCFFSFSFTARAAKEKHLCILWPDAVIPGRGWM